jgi:hypothetical protein
MEVRVAINKLISYSRISYPVRWIKLRNRDLPATIPYSVEHQFITSCTAVATSELLSY